MIEIITKRTALRASIFSFCTLTAQGALAHAQLQSANPPVGGSVSGSPSSLQLEFSEGVEARYSRVSLTGPGGAISTSGASNSGGKQSLRVRVGTRLKPGRYRVTWSVVSVDTHRTQGSFSFDVRP